MLEATGASVTVDKMLTAVDGMFRLAMGTLDTVNESLARMEQLLTIAVGMIPLITGTLVADTQMLDSGIIKSLKKSFRRLAITAFVFLLSATAFLA